MTNLTVVVFVVVIMCACIVTFSRAGCFPLSVVVILRAGCVSSHRGRDRRSHYIKKTNRTCILTIPRAGCIPLVVIVRCVFMRWLWEEGNVLTDTFSSESQTDIGWQFMGVRVVGWG